MLQRTHAWDSRFTPTGGRVLTDDWNPADLRSEDINLASRRRMLSAFATIWAMSSCSWVKRMKPSSSSSWSARSILITGK